MFSQQGKKTKQPIKPHQCLVGIPQGIVMGSVYNEVPDGTLEGELWNTFSWMVLWEGELWNTTSWRWYFGKESSETPPYGDGTLECVKRKVSILTKLS